MRQCDVAKQYPHLKVMEAFMYRMHPQWQKARQLVQEGTVGELRTVHSFFSYSLDDPTNIRTIAEIGGGTMMDIGCSALSFARFLFDAEPKRIMGSVEFDPKLKTDRLASGILDFGKGTSTFTCSTQLSPYQRVHICGTTGRIEIEIPANAPSDRPCRLWLEHDGKSEEITFAVCNQYTLQGDLFSQAVLEKTEVPIPIEESVANMKAIEAIFRSAKSGTWV